MKVNEIEQLLVRYYDGETNEAEEKELKSSLHKRTFRHTYLPRKDSSRSSPPNLNRKRPKVWKVN